MIQKRHSSEQTILDVVQCNDWLFLLCKAVQEGQVFEILSGFVFINVVVERYVPC